MLRLTLRTLRAAPLLLAALLPFFVLPANASAAEKKILFLYGDKSTGGMIYYREVFQEGSTSRSDARLKSVDYEVT